MSTPDGAFFEQFIEDYFAECDEHLTVARRAILDLESAEFVAPPPGLLQELLRSLHTLKGLSGMVGLASAERVAHAMEDSLGPARQSGAAIEPELTDALFMCVDLLARCIAARRTGAPPPPELDAVLAALAAVSAVTLLPATPNAPKPSADAAVPAAGSAGDAIYHFEFIPTRELSERGVGVEAVRVRLRSLGTVLDARPRIVDGAVAFDFSVSVGHDRGPDPAWRLDGLRWTREEPVQSPAVESAARVGAAEPEIGRSTSTAAAAAIGSGVVRVDLARLDAVMRLVGDLVIARSRLDQLLKQSDGWSEGQAAKRVRDALDETSAAMGRQLRRLREGVMRIRLVPVGEAFERLRFAIRDAARESGKDVALVVHGQNTEIDKQMVDRMLEPLLHLVRNAVGHGIETAAERIALGKPAKGTVTLRAATAGDRIIVDVEDDGAGIDVHSVEERARARGLLRPDEQLDTTGLLDVLCAPGFSTRDEADLTSGRGVGMDVVSSTVHSLGGSVTLETTAGRGTCFAIELPMTLMIMDALLVAVGDQQMAMPQPAVREVLQVDRTTIVSLENNEVIPYRGGVLPLLSLSRLFQLPAALSTTAYLLVVGSDVGPVGLLVDRLVGLREIIVHPVADPLIAVAGISGATELGDGRVCLILDSAGIVRMAHAGARARSATSAARGVPVSIPVPMVSTEPLPL